LASQVVLKYCPHYENAEALLREGLSAIGGIQRFVSPGQKVFLKINLLMNKAPEDAVTTHPAVVEAVVKLVQEAGGVPIIGDSPGGPYTVKALRSMYARAGLIEVAERTGAILNENIEQEIVQFPDGYITKSLTVTKSILDADVIIPISKMKTHTLMTFTGAVKVLFGVIPGLLKAEYHLRMPGSKEFASLLADICQWVNPPLSIMDGIVGMEGDGPSGGKPRSVGALLLSTDPFALDVAAVSILGIKPEYVPTIKAGRERGLPAALHEIELLGDDINIWNISDYALPKGAEIEMLDRMFLPQPLIQFLMARVRPYPGFDHHVCVGCGDCAQNCPAKVIVMGEKKRPEVNLKSCIRCFCCHELCPHKAVKINKPFLGKLLFK
jgi:uncharacterized protein (DUF362 family)/Pyruvate/2-oxoacid:ferredoxin oxidoreductase delta subunit